MFTEFTGGNSHIRHNQGGNLLYADGHAKWTKRDAMRYSDFGATGTGTCGAAATDKFPNPPVGCAFKEAF